MFNKTISKKIIDGLIKEISIEVESYKFKKESLINYNENLSEDMEFLSYMNGKGGNYVKFLTLLIKKIKPENIVELGNREGNSTIGIYEGTSSYGGNFTTIDIVKDLRYFPKKYMEDKKINIIYGNVFDLNIFNGNIPINIDLLFTDTLHYNQQLIDEFEIYEHLLSNTALIAIDDININDKRKFFDKLKFDKWDLTELCHSSGWGLFLFKRKEKESIEERKNKAQSSCIKVLARRYQELNNLIEQINSNKIGNRIKNEIKNQKYIYKKILPIYVYIYKKIKGIK